MTFLNPLLLLGLAAAVVPIFIHLLNQRKPRVLDFSSLVFLEALQVTTLRRMHLKQWLLLALRVLAVLLLALAFARPVWEGASGGAGWVRPPVTLGIVLDTSPSMEQRDAQGSLLEQALGQLEGLAAQFQPGDTYILMTTGGEADRLPQTFRTAASFQDALAQVRAAPSSRPLTHAVARAATALDEVETGAKALWIVSDLQASTLVDSIASRIPFDGPVWFSGVGEGRPATNVGWGAVRLASPVVALGQPVTVEVDAMHFGTSPIDPFTAVLYLNEVPVAQYTGVLAPNGQPTPLTFRFTANQTGWLRGRVASALVEDDLPLGLNVPETRRILLVHGPNPEAIRFVRAVLIAVQPSPFEVVVRSQDQWASEAFSSYDALVLTDLGFVSEGTAQAVRDYVNAGGGLWITPGQRPEAMQPLLSLLGAGSYGEVREAGAEPLRMEVRDALHPVFAGVFAGGREEVEAPEVYRYVTYTPPTNGGTALATLPGGSSIWQGLQVGQGRVFVSAIGLTPTWSDWPTRGLFVPSILRGLLFLAAGEDALAPVFIAGEGGRIRTREALTGTVVLEAGEGDGELLTPVPGAGFTWLDVPPLPRPGVYMARNEDRDVQALTVRMHPAEADDRRLSVADAQERIETATGLTLREAPPGNEVETALNVTTAGGIGRREMWNAALWLALIFLVAEVLVAHFWRPESTTPRSPPI